MSRGAYYTHTLDTPEHERAGMIEYLQGRGIEKPTAAQVDAALASTTDSYMAAVLAGIGAKNAA